MTPQEFKALIAKPRKNKYSAKRTEVNGITFASKRESQRYLTLSILQAAGKIKDLEIQPRYPIEINGILICHVILDFRYFDLDRKQIIVEDVKGGNATRTPVSRIKHKLVEAQHGIKVEIV